MHATLLAYVQFSLTFYVCSVLACVIYIVFSALWNKKCVQSEIYPVVGVLQMIFNTLRMASLLAASVSRAY